MFEHAHSIATDSDLGQLVAAGILVTHDGSLADSLSSIPGPQLSVAAAYAESPRAVFINNEPYNVPMMVWNAAARSALPLTLSDASEPPAISEDARYEAFRRFLSSADGVPNWDGFKRGFAFRRLFEDKLQAAVMATITDRNLTDKPIVLHGAAGTGKTTAAARWRFKSPNRRSTGPVHLKPFPAHGMDRYRSILTVGRGSRCTIRARRVGRNGG